MFVLLIYFLVCNFFFQLFFQIYNEQITDLLDPSQKHLQVSLCFSSHGCILVPFVLNDVSFFYFFMTQIREDVRTGVYVEYLTEEYVFTVKDVIQLLIKVCTLVWLSLMFTCSMRCFIFV